MVLTTQDIALNIAGGVRLQLKLEEAISHGTHDTGRKDTIQDEYLVVTNGWRKGLCSSDIEYLDHFGIDNSSSRWSFIIVENKDDDEGLRFKKQKYKEAEYMMPILEMNQDVEQGTIVITTSENKEQDALLLHPELFPDRPAVLWSDMVMDVWRQAAGSIRSCQGLRWIFHDRLDNELGTHDMVNAALKLVGSHLDDLVVKEQSEYCYEEFQKVTPIRARRQGFDILSGCVQIDQVLKLLADHHQELGNLRIKSVFVIGGPTKGGLSLAIQFGSS